MGGDINRNVTSPPGQDVYELTEKEAINELLVCVSVAFILFMQTGFALLENGSIRAKNSKNILVKNLIDFCCAGVIFWAFGFGIAYGVREDDLFFGTDSRFFLSSDFDKIDGNAYMLFIFAFSFATTSATIVSGSLAERTKISAYILFSILMTGFIFPVVVSWTWGGGWLSRLSAKDSMKFHDFAGGGVVHLTGGFAGLIGAYITGIRHGKEKELSKCKDVLQDPSFQKLSKHGDSPELLNWINDMQNDRTFEPNSPPFIVFGTMLLYVSWLFFNAGSLMTMFNPQKGGIAKVMMVTTLSATTGGATSCFIKPLVSGTFSRNNIYDLSAITNGILAGCVSITAAADRVEPWSAFLIGLIGSLVYSYACRLLEWLNIDDPIEAAQVHGFCGLWSLIAVGIFDNSYGVVTGKDGWKHFLMW